MSTPRAGSLVVGGGVLGVVDEPLREALEVGAPEATVELEAQAFDLRRVDHGLTSRERRSLGGRDPNRSEVRSRSRRSVLLGRLRLGTAGFGRSR